MESWLKYTSSDYDANVDKWKYVADHLDGTVIDNDKITKYLHQREQGESDDAYKERKKIVDYTPHFHRAALTLAGMLWALEYDANRRWTKSEGGEGLGKPKEEDTIMSVLWQNADGKGTNWNTLWHGATIDAISYMKFFVLVDGVRRDEEGNTIAEPSIKIIPPQSVLRPIYDDVGRLISAKVKTSTEVTRSHTEKPKSEDRYLIFNLGGMETWRETDEGGAEMISSRPYSEADPKFQYLDRNLKTPILPLFEVELPLRGNLGFIMAKKENAIFNQSSSADFQMWTSGFPKLFADVVDSEGKFDKQKWDNFLSALEKGHSVLPGAGNKFDAAPTASLTAKRTILANKVKEFFTTFFQAYGDAASERTATEIRQDFRAGVEAFLTLLSSTMDEAENAAFWRLEQIYFPNDREVWGGSFVERSTDFQPVDIEQRIDGLFKRYLIDNLSLLDVDTALDVLLKGLESDGIPVNDERRGNIRANIESLKGRAEQERSLAADFGLAA